MTVVEGSVESIGMAPLSGLLTARAAEFRSSGGVLVAPEAVPYPIVAGVVSADLAPGPARVTVQVGSHARGEFDVVVPDVGPVSLAELVAEAFPWEPDQVSEFVRLRDEARAASERAEKARDDAEGHATATAGDRVQTGLDRAATGADRVATGEDRTQTGLDRAATAGDRVQTGADRLAAAGSASGAEAARVAAADLVQVAAGHASDAEVEAGRAEAEADRAQGYADSFGLTTTTSTGAPGSSAAVTVAGDGPAYSLSFVVPQGAKGDKGDKGDNGEISQAQLDAAVASLVDNAPEALNTLSELADALGNDPNFATTVSTEIGKRALIDGAPAAYNTLGKLVTALQNHELGGSTDASLLTGALTDQVDASAAMVEADLNYPGGPGVMAMPLLSWVSTLYYVMSTNAASLESKSDVGHTHTVSDVSGLDTAMNAAITAREWDGTQAQYDALGTYDPNVTYYVEE